MAELKTKKNNASVTAFVNSIEHETRRKDAKQLLKIFREVTGKRPKMWGDSIIGYGEYHYKYKSGQEGDWPLTGFSPRKANLSLYIMSGVKQYNGLLKKLGKHKHSVSCLYINKLEDVDEKVLREMIKKDYEHMKKVYKVK